MPVFQQRRDPGGSGAPPHAAIARSSGIVRSALKQIPRYVANRAAALRRTADAAMHARFIASTFAQGVIVHSDN
jgi:hypothetical protein